jgi:hypothetical protein
MADEIEEKQEQVQPLSAEQKRLKTYGEDEVNHAENPNNVRANKQMIAYKEAVKNGATDIEAQSAAIKAVPPTVGTLKTGDAAEPNNSDTTNNEAQPNNISADGSQANADPSSVGWKAN